MNTPKGLGRTLIAAGLALGVGCVEARPEKPEQSMESLMAFIAAKCEKIVECSNLQREFLAKIEETVVLVVADSPDKCKGLSAALADARKISEELHNKCTGFADRDNDGHDYGWGYGFNAEIRDAESWCDRACPSLCGPGVHERCVREYEESFLDTGDED